MFQTNVTNKVFDFSRRNVLTGAAAGAAGFAAPWLAPRMARAVSHSDFDLEDPKTNLETLLKIQADLSGDQVIGGFGGYAWAWVPNEKNYMIFGTYGIGASRLEYLEDEEAYRFYHREVLYYLDPQTNKILETWKNPITDRTVEVLHILNDPVHRLYRLKGGRFSPPYPYQVYNDDIVFQLDIFRAEENNPMPRKEYPLHSQQSIYQSCELWANYSRLSEVSNPDITSASAHVAWARNGMWLPFMEMGNRPGHMVYHSQSLKLMGGVAELPRNILDYTEKNHPKYLEAPSKWQDLALNENTWSYSKKVIDQRRAEGRTGSVFGVEEG